MATSPIKKAQNGTYYFRANLGYDQNGKKIQKYRSGFTTKREAKEAYSKILLNAYEETPIKRNTPFTDVTFQAFFEWTYLPWYQTQVKESTFSNCRYLAKRFEHFYPLKVSEIQPIHVQEWQVKLAEEYGANYIRYAQAILSRIFDRAIVLGLITKNPSRIVGTVRKARTKIDFWTVEEFEKVISLLYKENYYEHYLYITFLLLFMTGMRIGEATALQWSDVNFETAHLTISKSLYYKTLNDYQFVEPKTNASIRSICIDRNTLAELREWKERQCKLLPDNGFVLTYTGAPVYRKSLARALTSLAGLAGVHRIRIHALRHSHASMLIEIGENPLLIKERLGHANIQTTLGTYGHLYPNTNVEIANKLSGMLDITPASSSVVKYQRGIKGM